MNKLRRLSYWSIIRRLVQEDGHISRERANPTCTQGLTAAYDSVSGAPEADIVRRLES
jgi:hypothetical protein